LEGTAQIMPKISPREIDILHLLAAGHSSKQIAGELNIAIKTVDNHRQNLLRKTGARSTAELVTKAVKLGLV
jgi:DNA-binding CsgD family transcriptional regulator